MAALAAKAKTASLPVDARIVHPQPSGGAGTAIHSGKVENLDPNTEVRGINWFGDPNIVGIGPQMMRDPWVRWCVAGWIGPVVGATWDFEPATDKPRDVECADFLYYDFFERNDFRGMTARGSTGYTRDGVSTFELTDNVEAISPDRFPLHPGGGQGIVYTGFHHRPRWSIDGWIQSPTNAEQILGFRQWIKGSDAEKAGVREVRFDRGDLIVRLTWDQEAANFDGFAQMRSILSPFKRKRFLETISSIRHEREGAPLAKISEPKEGESPTPAEREIADEIAENMRAHEQGAVRVPGGWDVGWMAPSGQDTGLRQDIDASNRDIAFCFGLQFMGLKEGSYALADVQSVHGLRTSAQRQARLWEYAFNVGYDGFSPVARHARLNYGPDVGVPRLCVRYQPTEAAAALLNAIPALVLAGVLTADDPLEELVRFVLAAGPRDPKSARTPKPTAPAAGAAGSTPETAPQKDQP